VENYHSSADSQSVMRFNFFGKNRLTGKLGGSNVKITSSDSKAGSVKSYQEAQQQLVMSADTCYNQLVALLYNEKHQPNPATLDLFNAVTSLLGGRRSFNPSQKEDISDGIVGVFTTFQKHTVEYLNSMLEKGQPSTEMQIARAMGLVSSPVTDADEIVKIIEKAPAEERKAIFGRFKEELRGKGLGESLGSYFKMGTFSLDLGYESTHLASQQEAYERGQEGNLSREERLELGKKGQNYKNLRDAIMNPSMFKNMPKQAADLAKLLDFNEMMAAKDDIEMTIKLGQRVSTKNDLKEKEAFREFMAAIKFGDIDLILNYEAQQGVYSLRRPLMLGIKI